jgi:hypothetical protein
VSQFRRKWFFVDAWIQRAMLVRVVVYWCASLLLVSNLVLCWDIWNGRDRSFVDQLNFSALWTEHAPVAVALLFVLPLALLDTLLITSRFAGPIYRLRSSMRALAAGEQVSPLRFRNDDFWQEVAEEFNAVAKHQEQLKKQSASASEPVLVQTACNFEPAPAH